MWKSADHASKINFNSAAHACAHRVTYDCNMLYGQLMASSKLSTPAPTPQPNLHSSRGPLLLCLQTVDSLKRNVPRSDEIRGAALLAGMPCRPHPHRKPARKNCSPTNTSRNNSLLIRLFCFWCFCLVPHWTASDRIGPRSIVFGPYGDLCIDHFSNAV